MLYFLFFLLASTISLSVSWKYAPKILRFPIGIYVGFYVITCLIGATWLGLPNNSLAWTIIDSYGINSRIVTLDSAYTYWMLLYAPLIIPPLIATLCYHKFLKLIPSTREPLTLLHIAVKPKPFLFTFLVLIFICILFMLHGHIHHSIVFTTSDHYRESILIRSEMIHKLGASFYGIIYTAMPALSQIALYQSIKKRSFIWLLLLSFTIVIICTFVLFTEQKSPIFVYLLSLLISYLFLTGIRILPIVSIGIICLLIMNIYQNLTLVHWNFLDNLYLIIFRISSAYPFYLSLFPKLIPFSGIDFGGDILGIAPSANDNIVVFSWMYPTVNWVTGSIAAPAHVIAYSQGGIYYSLITLLLIGIAFSFIAILGKKIKSTLLYAYYMQGLVSIYYLTQISLRSVLISSYGYIWTIFALLLLAIFTELAANSRIRNHNNPLVDPLLFS